MKMQLSGHNHMNQDMTRGIEYTYIRRPQRVKWIEWICETCNTLVRKPRNKVGIMHRRRFCSPECASIGARGAGNPSWRGGYDRYYGPNWDVQRELAYLRDNNTCQECGRKEYYIGKRLDVHHIIRFGDFKSYEDANNLSNLITLCHPCHMVIEWKEQRRRK